MPLTSSRSGQTISHSGQKRRRVLALGLGALVSPLGALAQQPNKIRRIGFLGLRSRSTPSNPDVYYDAFVQGLRGLGYIEGQNLIIEWRFANLKYELLPRLAAELVQAKVEVIVTHASQGVPALMKLTTTIPIVHVAMGDPISQGFAASLARPGGNVTGLSSIGPDLVPKQLELLMIATRKLSRVAILMQPNETSHPEILRVARENASKAGITILPVTADTPDEIERAFATMKRERAGAVIILISSFFGSQRRQIAGLAAQLRLPSIYFASEYAKAGGLMSYGNYQADQYRYGATYVDKILKGAKPGDLPIEQPNRYYLTLNRKTAKTLGLTLPQEFLIRADEVIE